MGLPAKRTTSSKRDMRRSHHALDVVSVGTCPKCGKPALSHRMCAHCGFYKGREVVDMLAALDKKERKKKEKELEREEKNRAKEEKKEEKTA